MPLPQEAQPELPAEEYSPAGQLAQAVAAFSSEKAPAAQFKQFAESELPTVVDALPAGHAVQLAAAEIVAYVPAEQETQTVAPAEEYSPTRQLTQALSPRPEPYLPAPQEVHLVDVLAEYMPAAQSRQPEEPVKLA